MKPVLLEEKEVRSRKARQLWENRKEEQQASERIQKVLLRNNNLKLQTCVIRSKHPKMLKVVERMEEPLEDPKEPAAHRKLRPMKTRR